MLINTAVLGEIDVSPENIFNLPDGIYGFERESDYALITKQDEDITLMWFQAVGADAPCFVVFNPFDIIEGYDPKLEDADLRRLGAASAGDLFFLVIAVVPEDISKITVNLKSPIVINRREKKARQVILTNPDYPIRHFIFEEGQEK